MLNRHRALTLAAAAASLGVAQVAFAGGSGCDADLDGSGDVGFPDILTVLASWGPCPGCAADLDDSGDVGFPDLLTILSAFGVSGCGSDFVATQIAGVALTEYPHFNYVRAFNEGDSVSAALDPGRFPGVVGTADVYVVAARTAAGWGGDASLTDARGGPDTLTFGGGSIQAATNTLSGSLDGDGGTSYGIGYDLVIDVNQNGQLDGGDYIDGYGDEAGFYVLDDLTQQGPLAVSVLNYSGGSFLGQRTYYPTNIASMGQLPLVIQSHGNGHQYTWYDYLGQHFASHGYIFMSHQNNTGPGIETASTTTLTNTDYLLGNLATIGGGVLDGHLDTSNIVWTGHSRGGEGVAREYDRLFDGTFTPSNYTIDDIKLVSSIAPTDFLGTASANPHGVDYHLLYGSADGDVNGSPGCRICQSFSLLERATGWRASTYLQGADHNDFNCCGFNDFQGPPGTEIGRPEAQRVTKAAYLSLVEHRIRGSIAAMDMLTRQKEDFKAPSTSTNTTVDREYKDAANSFVIDDFQTQTGLGTSSSGGLVTGTVTNRIENRLDDGDSSFTWTTTDPMNGMTRGRSSDATRGTVFDYNSDAVLEFEIIASERDLTDDSHLTFRACQGTRHPNTTSALGDLTFTVTLRDASGTSSSINIGAYKGGIEEPYQRTGSGSGAGWGNEFELIRMRLTDFLNNGSGLDLSDVEAVRFEFGPSFGDAKGRIGLDDIHITSD